MCVAAPSRSVFTYAWGVATLGLTVFALVVFHQIGHVPWASTRMASTYLLMVLLFLGELRPLRIAREDGDSDRVTVSGTFAVALVLCGPLVLAIGTQMLAAAFDDIRVRRGPIRVAFNAGQYALTVLGTRLAYALSSGHPVFETQVRFSPREVLPALLAAGTFFVLNNVTVGGVVALQAGQRLRDVLREDVRVQGMASTIVLGLAPVTAAVASMSFWMVPLLVLPLIGVEHNAWIATQRQHEALHDGLTGLPNRALFQYRAERAVTAALADDRRVAVMLLDLDHFKEVNDTLGHHVGDDLLREVARRVIDALPDGMTLARLGGDEFAIVLPDAPDDAAITSVADRVAYRLREPVIVRGVRISIQASIGIAICPDHAATVEMLLQRADIALYRAKGNRGEIQIYRAEIDQHTVLRLSLLGDLHTALDDNEFEMHYQPQVDSRNGAVVAVEALMRWRHPSHGMIPPDVFIPLSENTGLIGDLTRVAMSQSLATLSTLREGGHDLGMAVNISARLLSDLGLPRWIRQMLAAARIPPSRLTIEVTESTITADPKRAMQVLKDLREIGVRLAIDDFGTGYSSLSYLRRLKPDELKVDKSFVLQMGQDENSAVIVRSTIDLGHGLGLLVVAEGVEDQETYDALAALGCERIQGYHIARPMPRQALVTWLAEASLAQPGGSACSRTPVWPGHRLPRQVSASGPSRRPAAGAAPSGSV